MKEKSKTSDESWRTGLSRHQQEFVEELTQDINSFARMIGRDPALILRDLDSQFLPGHFFQYLMTVETRNEKVKKLLARLCENPNLMVSQSDFARLLDIDRSVPCRLLAKGILPDNGSFQAWFYIYCGYLKGIMAGRKASGYF